MLFLLFDLDGDRYALDAAGIAEVLALAPTKSIPGAPPWVAGMFERHGEPVPVIDVSQLALGRPARQFRSTRLVLVRYSPDDAARAGHADAAYRARAVSRQRHRHAACPLAWARGERRRGPRAMGRGTADAQ